MLESVRLMVMSKRLQVNLDDAEYRLAQRAAKAKRLTMADYVRQLLHKEARQISLQDPDEKLAAIRGAFEHSFPTADIESMLHEIEKGYLEP